jgi:hypothetical protein
MWIEEQIVEGHADQPKDANEEERRDHSSQRIAVLQDALTEC